MGVDLQKNNDFCMNLPWFPNNHCTYQWFLTLPLYGDSKNGVNRPRSSSKAQLSLWAMSLVLNLWVVTSLGSQHHHGWEPLIHVVSQGCCMLPWKQQRPIAFSFWRLELPAEPWCLYPAFPSVCMADDPCRYSLTVPPRSIYSLSSSLACKAGHVD